MGRPARRIGDGRAMHASRGFTLIEAIVVIVVSAIVLTAVALVLRLPVQMHADTARRAELTDAADGAVRRMARDLRLALPNSIRVSPAGGGGGAVPVYVEFLPTHAGGRYRAELTKAGAGDILNFSAVDTSFDMLGPAPTLTGQSIVAGNRVVVFNLGVSGASAYAGDNTNVVLNTGAGSLAGETKISFDGSVVAVKRFPLESPGNRFHVISTPVTYACDPGAGTLTRHSNYDIAVTQPTGSYPSTQPGGTASAVLADRVSACVIKYEPGVIEAGGLVSIRLTLGSGDDSVTLYQDVHVSNVP